MIAERAMRKDFSWDASARKYEDLYEALLTEEPQETAAEIAETVAEEEA